MHYTQQTIFEKWRLEANSYPRGPQFLCDLLDPELLHEDCLFCGVSQRALHSVVESREPRQRIYGEILSCSGYFLCMQATCLELIVQPAYFGKSTEMVGPVTFWSSTVWIGKPGMCCLEPPLPPKVPAHHFLGISFISRLAYVLANDSLN